jgi:hypothetical protein
VESAPPKRAILLVDTDEAKLVTSNTESREHVADWELLMLTPLPQVANDLKLRLLPSWNWSNIVSRAPNRTVCRTLNVEPLAWVPNTEQLLPKRPNIRKLMLLPRLARLNTDKVHTLPKRAIPLTDAVLPSRTEIRTDADEPAAKKSASDTDAPARVTPRSDKLLPQWKKSNRLEERPLAKSFCATDTLLPRRSTPRKLQDEPMLTRSSTLHIEPARTAARTDSADPNFAEVTTDSL